MLSVFLILNPLSTLLSLLTYVLSFKYPYLVYVYIYMYLWPVYTNVKKTMLFLYLMYQFIGLRE